MLNLAIVQEAADALPAIRQFIGTRLELADEQPTPVREQMVAVWDDVLTKLDTLDRALVAELSDIPEVAPA